MASVWIARLVRLLRLAVAQILSNCLSTVRFATIFVCTLGQNVIRRRKAYFRRADLRRSAKCGQLSTIFHRFQKELVVLAKSQNVCSFRVIGDFRPNSTQPLVVCVHGFYMHSVVWTETARALNKQGYRVIAIDLYGRGSTPLPIVPGWLWDEFLQFDDSVAVAQIADLLHTLGLGNDKFALMGHSMGGAISVRYTQDYPDRVQRLVLVAPAGLPVGMPLVAKLMHYPIIGDLLMATVAESLMIKRVELNFRPEKLKANVDKVERMRSWLREQLAETPGYREALSLTLENFPLNDLQSAYSSVGNVKDLPVLLIWADEDETTPASNSGLGLSLLKNCAAKSVVLTGVGHEIFLCEFQMFETELLGWLEESAVVKEAVPVPASSPRAQSDLERSSSASPFVAP